jgi:hypothetical protein
MKNRYMTQQYFDMMAVMVAQVAVYKGESEEETFSELLPNINHSYDDPLESGEVVKAAKKIRKIVKEFLPIEETSGNFTQLKFCVKNYEAGGKKRKKSIFGGTKLNYEKSSIQNKADLCIRNMACYVMDTSSGRIPFAPDGWKL